MMHHAVCMVQRWAVLEYTTSTNERAIKATRATPQEQALAAPHPNPHLHPNPHFDPNPNPCHRRKDMDMLRLTRTPASP